MSNQCVGSSNAINFTFYMPSFWLRYNFIFQWMHKHMYTHSSQLGVYKLCVCMYVACVCVCTLSSVVFCRLRFSISHFLWLAFLQLSSLPPRSCCSLFVVISECIYRTFVYFPTSSDTSSILHTLARRQKYLRSEVAEWQIVLH